MTTTQPGPAALVWVDLETDGLDPLQNIVLEFASIITDADLNPIAEMSSIVTPPAPGHGLYVDEWDPFVKNMHMENGLIKDLEDAIEADNMVPIKHVTARFVEFLSTNGVSLDAEHKIPLAGSNVANFDRPFMKEHMSFSLQFLHYRNVDVSTVKELFHMWRPDVEMPPKKGGHRALPDLRDSIDLLRHFRRLGFVGGPR